MDKDTIVITFKGINKEVDIDVPLSITAQDLIVALNEAYSLGIDTTDITMCYMQAENPIALLKGSKTLEQFGLRNGSTVHFTK